MGTRWKQTVETLMSIVKEKQYYRCRISAIRESGATVLLQAEVLFCSTISIVFFFAEFFFAEFFYFTWSHFSHNKLALVLIISKVSVIQIIFMFIVFRWSMPRKFLKIGVSYDTKTLENYHYCYVLFHQIVKNM